MKTLENGSFLTCFTAFAGPLPGASVWIAAETIHGPDKLYVPVMVPIDEEAMKRGHVSPTMMLCPVADLPSGAVHVARQDIQALSEQDALAQVFEGVCSCEHCRKRTM